MTGVYITLTAFTEGTVSLLKEIILAKLEDLFSLLNLKTDGFVLSNK